MSRGVYSQADLDSTMMRKYEPERYEVMLKANYIKGADVDRPAVISLNMLVASYAVNEMLARLKPYRIESNSEFAQWHISLTDPAVNRYLPENEICKVFSKRAGLPH